MINTKNAAVLCGWEYVVGREKQELDFFEGAGLTIDSMNPVETRQCLGVYLAWQVLLSLETYGQDVVRGKRVMVRTAEGYEEATSLLDCW